MLPENTWVRGLEKQQINPLTFQLLDDPIYPLSQLRRSPEPSSDYKFFSTSHCQVSVYIL